MDLQQDIALVTGATRGIGKAIAIELGRHGATVIGTATSESGAAAISDTLKQHDIRGQGIVLDVADQHSIKNFRLHPFW